MVIAVLFIEDPSREMLGLTIAGCLLYVVASSIVWLIIYYSILNKIENTNARFIASLVSGFVLLDGFLYLTDGGTANPKFFLYINAIHLLCFLTAFALSRKKERNHTENTIITD
nr:hypothetical protein [uncultured Mucilaginibacter sp.]